MLGLVRHMTQMEHVYLSWGLGGGERVEVYGDDDYAGGSVETVDEDLETYLVEVEKSDRAIANLPSLESPGAGHGRPLGATLVKMIDEYALHSGQAHMLSIRRTRRDDPLNGPGALRRVVGPARLAPVTG